MCVCVCVCVSRRSSGTTIGAGVHKDTELLLVQCTPTEMSVKRVASATQAPEGSRLHRILEINTTSARGVEPEQFVNWQPGARVFVFKTRLDSGVVVREPGTVLYRVYDRYDRTLWGGLWYVKFDGTSVGGSYVYGKHLHEYES